MSKERAIKESDLWKTYGIMCVFCHQMDEFPHMMLSDAFDEAKKIGYGYFYSKNLDIEGVACDECLSEYREKGDLF